MEKIFNQKNFNNFDTGGKFATGVVNTGGAP
jgi:hypothetical protein